MKNVNNNFEGLICPERKNQKEEVLEITRNN